MGWALGQSLDAWEDTFREWKNILSASDPHRVLPYKGQDIDQANVWWIVWPEGGCRKKKKDMWDWAVVRWIFFLYCGPCWCPLPGVAHKSVPPKTLLSPLAPQAPPWLTPCHIILWQRWWRESAEEWYWEVAGDLNTHTVTHTHAYTHLQIQ